MLPHSSEVAPEELEFKLRGGRLCLNLTATVGERWRRGFERLRSPADLSRWFVLAGVLERPTKMTGEAFRQARALREAVYRAVTAAMVRARPEPGDLRLINRLARGQSFAPRLDSRSQTIVWVSEDPARAALAEVARDAVLLLGTPDIRRVKECSAPDCSLLFFDASPAGRRRWCSMEICGNRSKTAAYRRRRAAPDSRGS